MKHLEILGLDRSARQGLWDEVVQTIEGYLEGVHENRVAPDAKPEEIRALLAPLDFSRPMKPRDAVRFTAKSLWNYQVHTPHPSYYGLFNPAPATMGIAADALVAAFNPQVATWNHSPFAVEVEQHLARAFGMKFGYSEKTADGTFASGGAEANHTALLAALERAFPSFMEKGARGLDAGPRIYVSNQSHHSIPKAARNSGLGSKAVREIEVDDRLQIKVDALVEQIKTDRARGDAPFLLVANAGTTNAGTIDPIAPLLEVAGEERLWLHVDAAWGGAGAFLPELRTHFEGIGQSDSITFDAHKWLSVPMGAGIFLTRHEDILNRTFRMTAEYMPPAASQMNAIDPYTHSLQWSRRFTGLKVFLSLLVAGWQGYEEVIRHQTAMGDLLRNELEASGWEILNHTPLPIVCFADPRRKDGRSPAFLEGIAEKIVRSGKAWISTTQLDRGRTVLRACITNYRTGPEQIHALVRGLDEARR